MKLLVDAHIGRQIIDFLVSAGHDVSEAIDFPPATSDEEILRIAAAENRVVMTSDKDFGELVFRFGYPAVGVVLLRITVKTEVERLNVLKQFWPHIEPIVLDHFVVVSKNTVRRIPLR